MWTRACLATCSLLLAVAAGCTPGGGDEVPAPSPAVPTATGTGAPSTPSASPPAGTSPTPAASPSGSPTATPGGSPTSTATPTPVVGTPTSTPIANPATPAPGTLDLRALRLQIPSLRLDAPVEGSQVIPDTSVPAPGCPAPPPGQTTLTVPNRGLATPEESIEGLEHKSWIFGHSRWAGEPGLLSVLPRLERGDEVIVDGLDRATSQRVAGRRYVVDGFYLTDIESGGALVSADPPGAAVPQVLLQTSVREEGAGKPWIFDRGSLLAKAENLVQGDLDDPCKYLLLFVVARAS